MQTGTFALGATQTKSKPLSSAMLKASSVGNSPNCSPVSEITNTLSAVISSLTKLSTFLSGILLIISPPIILKINSKKSIKT